MADEPINVNVTTSTTKPGFKTSEFWITTAITLVGLLLASGVLKTDSPYAQIAGLVAATLKGMTYTQSRANVKASENA